MKKASRTKIKLLEEAYKLFTSEPYDQVTFDDLEKATKLSRGAILYHIRTKENLFREVINKYVFDRNSLQKLLENNPKIGLWDFILAFLEESKTMKSEMKELGIKNPNLAMYNIECSAFFFPDISSMAKEWVIKEEEAWAHVLNNALENKEIKEDTDIPLMTTIFQDMLLGNAYHGIVFPKGQDLVMLKKEFGFLYNMIKY
jgi:AcrR family transcriptional regulator